jgi:hypothetical protein
VDEDAPLRVDLMAKLRVSTPAQERKCLGMDLRSPDLGPSRSAQLSGPRNLKEAFDAQPAGRGAELVLRSAADDGPFAFGPDRVDDGPVRGDWDVLEFDLLAPSSARSLLAAVSSPARTSVTPL